MFKLILQLHGNCDCSSTTTISQNSTYTPTEEEKRLWGLQADYQAEAMPYALDLLSYSKNLLDKSLGVAQVDFTQLNNESQDIIGQAQSGVGNLANGVLPSAYTDNMQTVLNNQVNQAMGTTLNNLAARGVLNSSVTNTALNDISKNATNTMADMYNTNIGTLNGLYGQMDTMASDKVTAAAAAQEAAQAPAMNLLNAASGNSANNTGAIGALKGTGTTTSTGTNTTSTSTGGLLGGMFNTAASFAGGALACFSGETKITCPDKVTKEIRDIEIGDTVMVNADGSDALVPAKVTWVQVTPNKCDIYLVEFQITDNSGKSYTDYVITTEKQSFLGANGEWLSVKELETFTKLKPYFGVNEISVSTVSPVMESITVYDLKIEGHDNYVAAGLISRAMY